MYPRAGNKRDSNALSIYLLGSPAIKPASAEPVRLRGYKPWGLLAYLLLSGTAVSREHAVSLLFGDADDPQAALRWNLTELRHALGERQVVGGDPLCLTLPPGTFVDVQALVGGSWAEALQVPGLGRELLEGLSFAASPAFEAWLLTERRHMMGVAEGVLREAALARLSSGDAHTAAQLAGRLVSCNSLDESYQLLLVRCLAAAGDRVEAARQVERCTELFRRELGMQPSATLAAAAEATAATSTTALVSGSAVGRAQLEAGRAAIAAGATEAGLECLRRAVVEARAAGRPVLESQALLALGAALVHSPRGRDDEGAPALYRALELATAASVADVAAAAARELGYIEFMRGRYTAAKKWARRAAELASDDEEGGRTGCLLGSILSDTAQYRRAIDELRSAAAMSERTRDTKQLAYTLSMLGRAHLMRHEWDEAVIALDRAITLARDQNWTAFVCWPETLRADIDLARGDIAAAADRYEYGFTLACQLGDPCWEGMACRGLGLVAAARGDVARAVEWLTDACHRCTRVPDAYVWVHVYALDALCDLAVQHDLAATAAWIEELAALSARTGMREFTARGFAYRARMGDETSREMASVLAGRIDNPALALTLRGGAPALGAVG